MDHLLSKENVTYIMVSYTLLVNKVPIKINLVNISFLASLFCLVLKDFVFLKVRSLKIE